MTPLPQVHPHVDDRELQTLRAAVEASLPAFLVDLEQLVNTDCGSYTKAGVDAVGRWTARFLERLGARVEIRPHASLGDTVVGRFAGRTGAGPRVVLIGHLDTVFEEGTARARPFRIEAGVAQGPGVSDMKSGLLAGLYALDALVRLRGGVDELPFERLTFIANPDEEIGSPSSEPHIRELAADADACFVLECARANGDIVSARKGTVGLRLTIHGRAAHAGVEPEKGRSAILEAARLVREIHALNGRSDGVTANVGVITGGTRANVVAERCTLAVDLRAVSRDELEAAEAAVRELLRTPAVPDTTVEWKEVSRHAPMERSEGSMRLVAHAQGIARRLGFEVLDAATGGASDANTTAGMGVPTLDGLGPVGGNDHSPAEYLEVGSIVPRTVLLAGLLLSVARDPAAGGARP